MTSRDFVFWLQGAFELFDAKAGLSADQVKVVKEHLDLVFAHDPQFRPSADEEEDEAEKPLCEKIPEAGTTDHEGSEAVRKVVEALERTKVSPRAQPPRQVRPGLPSWPRGPGRPIC